MSVQFGSESRSDSRVMLTILKEKMKNNLRKNDFLKEKKIFFKTISKFPVCHLKKFLVSSVSEL